MPINSWCRKWSVHPGAITELQALLGAHGISEAPHGISEAAIQQQIRVDSSKHGVRLWRNNNGATLDETGRMIRFGLGNDSPKINRVLKSSDLIGITPVTVTPHMVNSVVGVFTSIEVKASGWKYRGTDREKAQLAWLNLVLSLGGRAKFASTREGWK